jgi:hypothetical protein
VRTDVLVLDKELFRRSWYVEQLRVRHPDVYARARPQIEGFARQLERFEQDLPYEPAAIEAAFNAMLASLLAANYDHRPVYVTIEIEPQHSAGFRLVPVGLAFRLYRPEDVPPLAELPWPELRYRPFAADDRLPVALQGMYASMLLNRAVYAYRAGGFETAAPLFARALGFAPDDAAVRRWQQLNEAARSRPALAPAPAAAVAGAAASVSPAP